MTSLGALGKTLFSSRREALTLPPCHPEKGMAEVGGRQDKTVGELLAGKEGCGVWGQRET